MSGRPNYRGKRLDRERKKAAKRAAKQAVKAERTARRKGEFEEDGVSYEVAESSTDESSVSSKPVLLSEEQIPE